MHARRHRSIERPKVGLSKMHQREPRELMGPQAMVESLGDLGVSTQYLSIELWNLSFGNDDLTVMEWQRVNQWNPRRMIYPGRPPSDKGQSIRWGNDTILAHLAEGGTAQLSDLLLLQWHSYQSVDSMPRGFPEVLFCTFYLLATRSRLLDHQAMISSCCPSPSLASLDIHSMHNLG
jgi:hypothetical protein